MDLATLSALDDMLSDVLLDQTHLWFKTHKMNEGYQPLDINPDDILTIIQRRVIVEKDLDAAVKDLVKIPVFDDVLVTKKQKQDFKSHAKKYFGMYLATAGFDISQTDRYTAVTKKSEACVIATRDFDEGAELAQCAGSTAALTEQQDGELESDFSVIRTSRRGTFLFLGPARFVNHDCDPNCRFMWANNTSICFRALRPIRTNDEITTSYGDSYFGLNNRECLCATCESRGQGAYSGRVSGSESSASEKSMSKSENAPPSRSLRSRKAIDYCLRKKVTKQCPTPPSPESSGGSESAPLRKKKKKLTKQQPTPSSPTSSGGSDSAPDTPTRDSTDAQTLVTPVPTPTRLPKIEFPPFTDDEDDDDDVDSAGPRAPATEEDVEYLFSIESEVEDRLLYAMKGFHITEPKGKEVVRDYVEDWNPQPAGKSAKALQTTSLSSSSPAVTLKRNFRMSIDFLCSPPRDTDIEVQQNHEQSDAQESASKAHTARTRTKSGRIAQTKEIDPDRCASCKTLTPHEQKDDSGDCRRCHRHLLLYGVAWPSRSKDALVAKFEQQEKQKRDALVKIAEDLKRIEKAEAAKAQAAAKAERAAAERARKKALAKESRARAQEAQAQARSAAQAQAQAQRQVQTQARAQARLYAQTQAQAQDSYGFATAQAPYNALLPASHNAARHVSIRPKPAMDSNYDDVPSGPYRSPTSNSVAHSANHASPSTMGIIGDIPCEPYRTSASYDAAHLMGPPLLPAMGTFDVVSSGPYRPSTNHSVAHSTTLHSPLAMGTIGDVPLGHYRPSNSQDAAYLTNPPPQPAMGNSDDLLSGPYRPRPINELVLDVSPIITEQHPFHHAPYLVFVDPQDSSAKFWWIAVTVPRSQMDLSMPDIPTLPDGSIDPDLIIVRFLEDFKYAVCNISGLKLFLPDGPVYHGFVQSAGREFKKNLSVSRAFQFLDGHVPPNLRWRYMSFHLARPLSEIAGYVYHTEVQVNALLEEACQWELARVHNLNQHWQQQQREIQQLREIQAQLEIQAQQELLQAQQELEAQQELKAQRDSSGQEQNSTKRSKRRATDQPVKKADPPVKTADQRVRKVGGRGPGKKTLEKRRLEELERLRLEELDKMQHEELERVRLEELERERLEELERVRREGLERTRLAELEKARLAELEKTRLEDLERMRLEALAEAETELFDGPLSPAPTDLSDAQDEEDAQQEVHLEVAHQEDAPHTVIPQEPQEQEVPTDTATQEEIPMDAAAQEKIPMDAAAQEELPMDAAAQEELPVDAATQEELPVGAATQEEVPTEVATQEEVPTDVATQEEVPTDVATQEELSADVATQEEVQVPNATQEEAQLPDAKQEEVQLPDATQEEVQLPGTTQEEVQAEVEPQEETQLAVATQEVHQEEEVHPEQAPQVATPQAAHQEEALVPQEDDQEELSQVMAAPELTVQDNTTQEVAHQELDQQEEDNEPPARSLKRQGDDLPAHNRVMKRQRQ
ncbi:Histone-lysine N-methyltransferase set9 [Mortierella alpina]|nr:Histone-lysine N-methyltransferase set9 [Mortierella alpina]